MARLAKGEQIQILTEDLIDDTYGNEPSGHPYARPEAPRITANYLPAGNVALSGSVEPAGPSDIDYPQAYSAEYTDGGTYITVT